MSKMALNLVGQAFGRLIVLLRSNNAADGHTTWLCRCSCGAHAIVRVDALRKGATVSCGCKKIVHGMRKVPEYNTWSTMIQRCHNPNHPRYQDYGGRGISVCDRWITSFADFYSDVGPRLSPKHSLDRENNDKGYEPGNCHWATAIEQGRNMRRNRWICVNGERRLIGEWAEIVGLSEETIRHRLNRGMSEHDAVLTPSRQRARV